MNEPPPKLNPASHVSAYLRAQSLKTARFVRDLSARVTRLESGRSQDFPYVLGESITPLRNVHAEDDRVLTRGRIENLRQACRRLNGTRIGPDQVFSFWKQVGPPWRMRGFRFGNDIRDGKIIPSTGGGLCQLSRALFDSAIEAGLRVLEHHDAGEDRALVAWNYVDLRLSAFETPVLIETWMTPNELIVRVRGTQPLSRAVERVPLRSSRAMLLTSSSSDMPLAKEEQEYALSGEELALTTENDGHIKTAAILDACEPEFESYLTGELIDLFLMPVRLLGGIRYQWYIPSSSKKKTVWPIAVARSIYSWFARRRGAVPAEVRLKTAEWLARGFAEKIPFDVEHIIVAQDFLPFLWKLGALQGRTFDVLLTRPALSLVHETLDRAAERVPASKTLREYRAARDIVEAEAEALVYADRVITPHEEYAKHYPNLRKLEWQKPDVVTPPDVPRPQYLLFPTSLTSRDGAHAALHASDELALPLVVIGGDSEGLAMESDQVHFISEANIPWAEIAAVIHPTLFESWPRLHLHALALGIPVIATEGAGLEEGAGVTIVEFGDEDGITRAIERVISRDSMREHLQSL